MTIPTDLFGKPRIQIRDNAVLERAANRLFIMCQKTPELLDGDSMGQIDRRIYAEILWEDAFKELIKPDRKQVFIDAVMKVQESDVYTRARRYLLEHDIIRLKPSVIKKAEQMRSMIEGAMR